MTEKPVAGAWLRARIVSRRSEARDIISIGLVAADASEPLPPFEAGAHVDVKLSNGLVRQYSLMNDPAERGRYRLGVLLEPASRGGSAEVHGAFHLGREIEISPPRNHFPLRQSTGSSLLLAGGIGVTPMMAMAEQLATEGASFTMHYCFRDMDRAAFVEELRAKPWRENVRLHRDDGPADQKFDAAKPLRDVTPEGNVYVCGPGGFIDHVTRIAAFAGWQQSQIHVERFTAAAPESAEFIVVAARSGIEVRVGAGQRISQALRAAGVAIEMSCEAGVCGTCFTKVLEGVPDHRDLFQTAEEKALNDGIALCCSGAKSAKLVLDI